MFIHWLRRHGRLLSLPALVFAVLSAPRSARTAPPNTYVRTNLVSDLPLHAENRDPNLVNPWGIAASSSGPFWISDNGTGLSTLYNTAGKPQSLVVSVPPPNGGMPPSAPTGIVFNSTSDFTVGSNQPALFIFATEDGTISGWNPNVNQTQAILEVDNSVSASVYKGLALGNNGSGNFLYATDFHNGKVDVFDHQYAPGSLTGSFADPNLPSGYAPFGIQNIANKLYVTYALQDDAKHDDVPGPGHGYVDIFDLNGNLLQRLISAGSLNSPWGLAMAPAGFGGLGSSLLVGNFGDGTIHGFNPSTGAETGQVMNVTGRPMVVMGLWGLIFGNGGQGGDAGVLYFSAGIPGSGEVEDHGLFGSIRPLGK